MSFAEIHRVMKALVIDDESEWRKFRRIAFEVWRKDTKSHHTEQMYMPIGDDNKGKEMTEQELDEIWAKYGKLKN